MSTAHDEPKDVTVVYFSSQLFKGEWCLEAALQAVQLLDESVVVVLDQVSEMLLALFRRCARQEEVRQLHSWSTNSRSLKVHNGQVGWIRLVLFGVSENNIDNNLNGQVRHSFAMAKDRINAHNM